MKKVNIAEKLNQINDHWNPRIVAELNGQHVRLVKIQGEFVWHKHDNEDEMFYVLRGTLEMQFRDKSIEVAENEFIVVPKGVEHKPVAKEEVAIILFEPSTTLNTGNTRNEFTKEALHRI